MQSPPELFSSACFQEFFFRRERNWKTLRHGPSKGLCSRFLRKTTETENQFHVKCFSLELEWNFCFRCGTQVNTEMKIKIKKNLIEFSYSFYACSASALFLFHVRPFLSRYRRWHGGFADLFRIYDRKHANIPEIAFMSIDSVS